MSVARALAALSGQSVHAYGLTWTTPDALRQVAWGSGVEQDAELLAAVASAFEVDLAFVDGSTPWAGEAVTQLHSHDIAAAVVVDGVLTRVAAEHGWSDTIAASAREPGELAYALDEALHEALVATRASAEIGGDVLVIADELASTAGWLVSPDFAIEALVPCYARCVQERGLAPAVFHSDGDFRALFAPLARIGFAGVHLASPDLEQLVSSSMAAHAAGLCPVGGVRASALRTEGARRSAEQALALAMGRSYVIADDGGMTSAEEMAAFGAALEAARTIEKSRGDA